MVNKVQNGAPKPRYFGKDFFVYQIDVADVLAGDSEQASVVTDDDADFLFQKAAYFTDLAGAVQTQATRVIPLLTVLITDTRSGRNLMNAPVPLASIFGTGQLPFINPIPKLFPASATITVALANFSGATDYGTPRLSFIGTKLFRQP